MSEEPQMPEVVKAYMKFAEAFGRALIDHYERLRPAFEQLAEIANRPEVRAMIEAGRMERAEQQPCHCLCGKLHPDDQGVCDGEGVTTRRFTTEVMGPVDVPLCAPCAAAQGMAELAAPTA